jgi:hypothetical protein
LFRASSGLAGRWVAAAVVLVTGVWSYVLLDRTPDWLPWLRWAVLVAGVLSAVALLVGPLLVSFRRLVLVSMVLALVAGLAGPTAYALDAVSSAHAGALPSAGPAAAGFGGGGPGGFAGARPGGAAGARTGGAAGALPGGAAGARTGGAAGQFGGGPGAGGTSASGTGGARGFGGGAGGGLSGNTQVSSALVKLLEQDASSYKWVAATEGSEGAAPLELATGDAVVAIGGFNGTDPWPTLAVFKAMVANHEIHYYVGQGSESFGGGRGSSAITSWVAAHFKKETVGGQTVYDLTQPLSGTT